MNPEGAKKFKVLADECRLRVLELLSSGPKSVSDMARQLDIPQNLLSHHLKILRDSQFVDFSRKGNTKYYELAKSIVGDGHQLNLGCCRIEF
jgi:ArsR family transcriptional regulator